MFVEYPLMIPAVTVVFVEYTQFEPGFLQHYF
jgi:hypothetical protein